MICRMVGVADLEAKGRLTGQLSHFDLFLKCYGKIPYELLT